MDESTGRLIRNLHDAGYCYAAAVTGGGAQGLAMLLNVPGASRALLEALVAYHPHSLAEFLGMEPAQSCSAETCLRMAEAALARARKFMPGERCAGIGATASLASDRPKKGDHRFHLGIATDFGVTSWSLTLAKGQRDREGEEAILDAVLLNAMADVFGVPERLPVAFLEAERLEIANHAADASLDKLYCGSVPAIRVDESGQIHMPCKAPLLLLPGSFNPLHEGHRGIAAAAQRRSGSPVAYEISIDTVDKPPPIVEDVCRRARQFRGCAEVWLTRAPLFANKAALFPGAAFAIGYDTAERLVQPRCYGDSEERMRQALAAIRGHGCRFLVAGRHDPQRGRFLTLEDVAIPEEFRTMFEAIPESDFRLDVSSTEMRARQSS